MKRRRCSYGRTEMSRSRSGRTTEAQMESPNVRNPEGGWRMNHRRNDDGKQSRRSVRRKRRGGRAREESHKAAMKEGWRAQDEECNCGRPVHVLRSLPPPPRPRMRKHSYAILTLSFPCAKSSLLLQSTLLLSSTKHNMFMSHASSFPLSSSMWRAPSFPRLAACSKQAPANTSDEFTTGNDVEPRRPQCQNPNRIDSANPKSARGRLIPPRLSPPPPPLRRPIRRPCSPWSFLHLRVSS